MNSLPKALRDAIEAFGSLPGVGPRTAERYVLYLLNASKRTQDELAQAIADLQDGVAYCSRTFALVEPGETLSPLYSSPKRNQQLVAVVEDPLDVVALEKTNEFRGTYHVLGGVISPIEGIGPEQLRIKELIDRIEEDSVEEVILATNADVEGESTALYIQKQLSGMPLKVTRLARGLPVGVDLEYADQITLSHAIEGRTSLE